MNGEEPDLIGVRQSRSPAARRRLATVSSAMTLVRPSSLALAISLVAVASCASSPAPTPSSSPSSSSSSSSSSSGAAASDGDPAAAARQQLDGLASAWTSFSFSSGRCPRGLEEIAGTSTPLDPWGRPIALMPPSAEAAGQLVSAGSDGELLTHDDVTVAVRCDAP